MKKYILKEDWEVSGTARPMSGGVGGYSYGATPEDALDGVEKYLQDYPYGGYMTTFGYPTTCSALVREGNLKLPKGFTWRVRLFRSASCE